MKKLNDEMKKEFDLIQNEYFVNQNQIRSQIEVFIRQRNLAIIFSILCLFISTGIVTKSLFIAGEAKKIDKVVFKEDGSGGITYLGVVNNGIQINFKKYILNQLSEYVTALNTVPKTDDMKQYNVYKVQYMTEVKYYPMLQSYLRDLYTKNVNNEVSIKITSVGEVTKGVWELDWTQYINGTVSGNWKTMITFKQLDNNDDNTLIMQYNPLDIAVTNVENSQRLIAQ